MIRVLLPTHLWRLANVGREVQIEVEGTPSVSSVLDALEECYPMLRGTIRDHVSKERRPFVRFFACGEDWSDEVETPLPEEIVSGKEPLWVVGSMAGG